MKIAIMTQPLGKNYGGIMQAWALQQVLKRMGHEPVTIDRQPDQPGTVYLSARFAYRAAMKAFGKRKAPINFEKHLPTILQHTQSFIDQHLTMSEPLYSTQQLIDHFDRENYDAVIVGSDQTWRPKYSPNIYNYFLDFLEDKKILRISYASSFGVDEWEFTDEQTNHCVELAKKFDAISVREDSGVELCRKYLGIDAVAVLDPTLLLDKHCYEELIGSDKLKNIPEGVYTYFLDKTPEKLALAKQASVELDEPLYSSQAKCHIGEDAKDWLTDWSMPDIKQWLTGFANARFILTDSFHGMVFSIIFNRPFIAIGNQSRGQTRFESLLKNIDLTNRLASMPIGPTSFNGSFFDEPIWDIPIQRLQKLQKQSLVLMQRLS
ncbi:polysaccharide pyruvyl transferase family protein [Hydrogenophaga sp.]|uniref:polysaccharide pyruvyl transferase family protein n=1 Tax=Hydrogenophaga sp. TaxID=1904254 RepID=UPI003F6D2196